MSSCKQTRSRQDLLQVVQERRGPVLLSRGPETFWHRQPKHTVKSTFGDSGSLGKHMKMCLNFVLLWPRLCVAREGMEAASAARLLSPSRAAPAAGCGAARLGRPPRSPPFPGSTRSAPGAGLCTHRLPRHRAPRSSSLNLRGEQRLFGEQIFHTILQLC